MSNATISIVKSKISTGYVVAHEGKYRAKAGGYYFGCDAAMDRHAVTQSLKEIREDMSILGYDISALPVRWPRGKETITIELTRVC